MFTIDNIQIFHSEVLNGWKFLPEVLAPGRVSSLAWTSSVCEDTTKVIYTFRAKTFQSLKRRSEIFAVCTLMWFFPSLSQSLSVFGLTGTTTWWTVSGTESSPFRSTHVGKCMIFSESFFTSNECSVAEQTITYNTNSHLLIKNCSWLLSGK